MFTKGILKEQGVGSSLGITLPGTSKVKTVIVDSHYNNGQLCVMSSTQQPGHLISNNPTGTYLCSASANTLNQIFETPFDAQMSRTQARPLWTDWCNCSCNHGKPYNSLPVANLILYAFFYTPLKRISITNTWLGALVGAIPALMGATAAGAPLNQLSSWLPAGLIYVWQFPHFNSLAHTLQRDYCWAGYQMMSNVTAELNSRVSLRYALMTIPLCSYLVPSYGLTNQLFGWISLIPKLFLIEPAFLFWLSTPIATPILSYSKTKELVHKILNCEGTKARQDLEAKKLFWASLIHLPQSQDDINGEIKE
ncbi:hypothetical protein BY996DRAFT_8552362 [Phakopsora pachyrhizi]|nr:hypothetical protein BY996DRAFT_8552362 [Phakopsora pachyrhizi]